MDTSAFLKACSEGNKEQVASVVSLPAEEKRTLFYSVDEEGRNALHLAVLNGHWDLSMFLLNDLKISAHKLTNSNESIFHSYARGLGVRLPTAEDFAAVRELNVRNWEERKQAKLKEMEDLRAAHPKVEPIPEEHATKNVEAHTSELFDNPVLFLPKYMMLKFHVVLNRTSDDGKKPADLANELGFAELAQFYGSEMEPDRITRRFVRGLNDDLLKKIVFCL